MSNTVTGSRQHDNFTECIAKRMNKLKNKRPQFQNCLFRVNAAMRRRLTSSASMGFAS